MGTNIEIKARCPNLKKAESIVRDMNLPFMGKESQIDTFYNVPVGRLKLRKTQNGARLIPYFRDDAKGPRQSNYALLEITDDVNQLSNILKKMFGIRATVDKTRKIYLYENVRIHLDKVTQLGEFIELEGVVSIVEEHAATLEKVEMLMELLEIKQDDLIIQAYVDMLPNKGDPNEAVGQNR